MQASQKTVILVIVNVCVCKIYSSYFKILTRKTICTADDTSVQFSSFIKVLGNSSRPITYIKSQVIIIIIIIIIIITELELILWGLKLI
jgi:hypothetical protein